jgi:hypothetical protein
MIQSWSGSATGIAIRVTRFRSLQGNAWDWKNAIRAHIIRQWLIGTNARIVVFALDVALLALFIRMALRFVCMANRSGKSCMMMTSAGAAVYVPTPVRIWLLR